MDTRPLSLIFQTGLGTRLTSIIMPTGIYQKPPNTDTSIVQICSSDPMVSALAAEFLFEMHKSLHHASYIVLFFLHVNLFVLVIVDPSKLTTQSEDLYSTINCKMMVRIE